MPRTITLDDGLIDAIERYLKLNVPRNDDQRQGAQLVALNAVAFIGERVVGAYVLAGHKETK